MLMKRRKSISENSHEDFHIASAITVITLLLVFIGTSVYLMLTTV
jgi:hypothetical protein